MANEKVFAALGEGDLAANAGRYEDAYWAFKDAYLVYPSHEHAPLLLRKAFFALYGVEHLMRDTVSHSDTPMIPSRFPLNSDCPVVTKFINELFVAGDVFSVVEEYTKAHPDFIGTIARWGWEHDMLVRMHEKAR